MFVISRDERMIKTVQDIPEAITFLMQKARVKSKHTYYVDDPDMDWTVVTLDRGKLWFNPNLIKDDAFDLRGGYEKKNI